MYYAQLIAEAFSFFSLFVLTQTTENRVVNPEQKRSDNAFSPCADIVYQLIPAISLYASYSREFNPVTGTAFDGSTFHPERGTQYEVGIKADLNDRLSMTLAFYDLTYSNVLINDPVSGIVFADRMT
ncbi:MAG: TonB-dependent receptor [Nostoc sp.]